jgi:predicted DNA-binding transcriptional regulator YafY
MVLSSAVQAGRRVVLRYRSARGELTERAFDPYGIAYHRGFWYTIGYCHLRAGQRLFRLDRIAQIEMIGDTFPKPVQFRALEAVSQALASVPRVWQVVVWLETSLEYAVEQTRQPRDCFEEANGGVLLRVDVEDLPWMAHLLAGLGVPFIVDRPRELCDVVRQYAGTLVSYAEQSDS